MFTLIPQKITAIPTTLITGFLGVGKTTAILQLLANKPQNEKWAVLVNEFGEIGIDSALLAGKSNEKGVFIREVPGGCMCCASGVPMQVALNQLIAKSKPDRLFIEPTGLGHPKEVVNVLTHGKYQEIIALQSIMCLVDARNLNDSRYTNHPSFIEQLNIADVILAAKADTYSEADKENLSLFLAKNNLTEKTLHLMKHGNINSQWITRKSPTLANKPIVGIATPSLATISSQIENNIQHELELNNTLQTKLEKDGFVELNNQGEGYFSKGWIFSNNAIFNHKQILTLITSLNVTRAKGVVITEQGSYAFNKTTADFSCNEISQAKDSRIELIAIDKAALNNLTYEQLLLSRCNH